jgi:hypothetical protein
VEETVTPDGNGAYERLVRWFFSPLPNARVVIFRKIVYAFVFVDVLFTTRWVAAHAEAPRSFYQPLLVARLLHLPGPTSTSIVALEIALLVAAAVALFFGSSRVAGAAVFVLYLAWMFVAMSYGKVDHDRFAFLIALAVLPTVAAGEDGETDAAGWAVRCIQLAVVATYFFAAFAKLRFGGIEWLNGGTLLWATLRRGTFLADPLLAHPWTLHVGQYLLVGFELASPLLLVPGRVGRWFLAGAFVFHLVTYATITIIFLPHIVCLLAFLPLEELRGRTSPAQREEGAEAPSFGTL